MFRLKYKRKKRSGKTSFYRMTTYVFGTVIME
jgi:hypothetical protein